MSYIELLGPDGKIDDQFINNTSTVPPISKGQLISGNFAGNAYTVVAPPSVPGSVLSYTVDPFNASGLTWSVVPSAVQLTKGQLLTGTSSVAAYKLDPPALNGLVLSSNNAVDPGLQWVNVNSLISAKAPVYVEPNSAFGGVGEVISLGFTPNVNGEIPVGTSTPGGDEGILLPRGTQGQVLQVNTSATNGTGLNWAHVVVDVNPGTNITIPDPANPLVSLSDPLGAQLNVGTHNIIGSTAKLEFTDLPNTTIATLNASSLIIKDSGVSTGINSTVSETGIVSNNATNSTQHNPLGLSKTFGATALTIAHTVATGPIAINTLSGTADITTNCAIQPAKIKDSAGAVGNSQFLTCNGNGALVWAAGVGAVTTAGGSNIAITGPANAPIISLASPLNATLAMGTQGLRDTNLVLGTSGQILTSTGTGVAWATAPAAGGTKYALVQLNQARTFATNVNTNAPNSFPGTLTIVSQSTNDNITFTIANGELVYTGTGTIQLFVVASSLTNTVQMSGGTNIDFINDSQWFPYFNALLNVDIYVRTPTNNTISVGGSFVGNNSAMAACQYNFTAQGSTILTAGGNVTLGISYGTNYIFNSNFQSAGLVAFDVAPVAPAVYITAIRLI